MPAKLWNGCIPCHNHLVKCAEGVDQNPRSGPSSFSAPLGSCQGTLRLRSTFPFALSNRLRHFEHWRSVKRIGGIFGAPRTPLSEHPGRQRNRAEGPDGK